ncbi:MAG: tyrosine-type recombinase/integrase [Thermomicrobiales bacterium]
MTNDQADADRSNDESQMPPVESPVHRSRFADRDAVTAVERDRPPVDDTALLDLEEEAVRDAARTKPSQLALDLETETKGAYRPEIGGLAPLDAGSSLNLARTWFRRDLELGRRPRNTIESYSYDLMVLEEMLGPKPINKIDRRDIAHFLGDAHSKTTRKRRLTSLRQFFGFLIKKERVLKFDPTEGYYPHQIQLRSPVPLFRDEQDAMLAAAANDEPWSATAIWLMMRLGLTRSELLALRRDHIDRASAASPTVFVFYDNPTKQVKERQLATDQEFSALYDRFLEERNPEDVLFPFGPPAINGMVERVRRAAGITKDVTPQTLRHTFAVEQAREGADAEHLLKLLGLANDARNRASVERYIRLAEPPLTPATGAEREASSPAQQKESD